MTIKLQLKIADRLFLQRKEEDDGNVEKDFNVRLGPDQPVVEAGEAGRSEASVLLQQLHGDQCLEGDSASIEIE